MSIGVNLFDEAERAGVIKSMDQSKKHCPACGAVIPSDSVFCQECGNQIISNTSPSNLVEKSDKKGKNIKSKRKERAIILVLSIFLVACCIWGTIFTVQVVTLTADLKEKEETISELRSTQRQMSSKLSFLDNHIAIVSVEDKNTYHRYDCPLLDTSRFWAYNDEQVKDSKKPCPYCVK